MPQDIKMIIQERQLIKEEERRINIEMRRLAEEEILRELRMAEDYYLRSGEFSKTQNKLFPLFNENESQSEEE
jgi:hypothetical protein